LAGQRDLRCTGRSTQTRQGPAPNETKEGYESEAQTTFAFNVSSRLKEIAVPTTIIHGDKDATVPVARAHEIAEAIPGATLHVLPGEGHFANVQVPEKVNPLLARGLAIPDELVPKR
jgi:pimeloyl-ACP methyl ester carboxylesterase